MFAEKLLGNLMQEVELDYLNMMRFLYVIKEMQQPESIKKF
jgi:hypothetical protein